MLMSGDADRLHAAGLTLKTSQQRRTSICRLYEKLGESIKVQQLSDSFWTFSEHTEGRSERKHFSFDRVVEKSITEPHKPSWSITSIRCWVKNELKNQCHTRDKVDWIILICYMLIAADLFSRVSQMLKIFSEDHRNDWSALLHVSRRWLIAAEWAVRYRKYSQTTTEMCFGWTARGETSVSVKPKPRTSSETRNRLCAASEKMKFSFSGINIFEIE